MPTYDYKCDACDHEFQTLLDFSREPSLARTRQTPPGKCPQCGGQAELDEAPDGYLSFLEHYPAPEPSSTLRRILIELEMREVRADMESARAGLSASMPPPGKR